MSISVLPLPYGSTATGGKRFIPITGGRVTGPKLEGTIVANTGGNWNCVHVDEVVHLYARYTIQASGRWHPYRHLQQRLWPSQARNYESRLRGSGSDQGVHDQRRR
ncbi:hypothetical protein N7510_010492 [Penicillium lagena]|uniref:uncharacterized protein n=1 Tax=Penicillium lagena TaxID=94218 RepID=UPI00253FB289|nr:uncharacterized protein N7510_010492 [Penicillium lagena]KAJ5605338.1 hypothetical protein N7510_010492 [Penicillium lagena]